AARGVPCRVPAGLRLEPAPGRHKARRARPEGGRRPPVRALAADRRRRRARGALDARRSRLGDAAGGDRRDEPRDPVFEAVPHMKNPNGPLRVGIGGPVGSGKTTLAEKLCKAMRDDYSIAVVTNDIYTKEDAMML